MVGDAAESCVIEFRAADWGGFSVALLLGRFGYDSVMKWITLLVLLTVEALDQTQAATRAAAELVFPMSYPPPNRDAAGATG